MVRNRFLRKIGIIIPFLPIFLMSQNTFAQNMNGWSSIQYYYRTSPNASYTLSTKTETSTVHIFQNKAYGAIYRINASGILPNSLKGSSFSGTADITFTVLHDTGIDGGFQCPSVVELTIRPEQGTITSEQSQVVSCGMVSADGTTDVYKVKIQSAGNLSAVTTVTSFYLRVIGTESKPVFDFTATPTSYTTLYMTGSVNFTMSTDASVTVMGEIKQEITNINNTIENHYNEEREAIDNIENQQPSDMQNTDNAATTNLIGVLGNFVNQLRNFSATNCDVVLPLPQFIGGNTTVNICQNKDKAGNIISIAGSLIMIGFYIPLAIVLLRMIYGEIRSFTNG